jgi:hypothetical protein
MHSFQSCIPPSVHLSSFPGLPLSLAAALGRAWRAVRDHVRAVIFPHELRPSWVKLDLGPPTSGLEGTSVAGWRSLQGAEALQAGLQGALDTLRRADVQRRDEAAASEAAAGQHESWLPGGDVDAPGVHTAQSQPSELLAEALAAANAASAAASAATSAAGPSGVDAGAGASREGQAPPSAAEDPWSEASTAGRSTSSLGFESSSVSGDGSATSDQGRRQDGAFGGADLSTISRLVLRLDRIVAEGGGVGGIEVGCVSALFEVLPEEPEEVGLLGPAWAAWGLHGTG